MAKGLTMNIPVQSDRKALRYEHTKVCSPYALVSVNQLDIQSTYRGPGDELAFGYDRF
jgi:hypothetical protein